MTRARAIAASVTLVAAVGASAVAASVAAGPEPAVEVAAAVRAAEALCVDVSPLGLPSACVGSLLPLR